MKLSTKKVLLVVGILIISSLSIILKELSIPRLYAKSIIGGTIKTKIQISTILKPYGHENIISKSDNRILSIPVKKGDKVQAGDILCIYESEKNDEFEYLLSQLMDLRAGYKDYAASGMPVLNYTEQNEFLTAAKAKQKELEDKVEKLEEQLLEAKENGELFNELQDELVAEKIELENQKKTVSDLQTDLENANETDQATMQNTIAALEWLNEQSIELQKLLKKIEIPEGQVITAPKAGVVEEVNGKQGKRAPIGKVIITLSGQEKETELDITVPNEYAEPLYNTSKIRVRSYYWNYENYGLIESISSDPSDPEHKEVKIICPTNEAQGHTATVELTKEEYYNCLIPVYAIQDIKTKPYIFVVEEKKILLNKVTVYKAKKQEITIIEMNDNEAAVRENLNGQKIILATSGQIRNGQTIRIQK